MRFLITGGHGQLAREFIRRFERLSLDFRAPGKSEMDITDEKKIGGVVAGYRPDVIINCAAYNLVDKAEDSPEAAFTVNVLGPKNLARAAAAGRAMLVHFGSDYVFDGLKESGLYVESDPANPLNEYGRSKLAGEENVLAELERSLVLRLSWVFGLGRQNFIYKLSQWAASNEYLKIACDEFSVPTWTGTVVDVTLKAIDEGVVGRYHLTNSGFCSRYEWAKEILGCLGNSKFIRPVSMDAFKLPAPRPKFSAMSNSALAQELGIEIPTWQKAVGLFIEEGGINEELGS